MPSKFRQKMLCYLEFYPQQKAFSQEGVHTKASSQKLYQSYMISQEAYWRTWFNKIRKKTKKGGEMSPENTGSNIERWWWYGEFQEAWRVISPGWSKTRTLEEKSIRKKTEMLQRSKPIKGRFSCLLETVSSVNNTQTKNKEPLKLFNRKLQGKKKIDHTAQDDSDICI